MKPIEKYPYILNPLFGFTLPNFPFIEDTFDGLTLYELISKSNEELDKIIKNVNVLESNVNILNDNINEVNDIKADKTIVKNVNTTSESDTYSCNYLNNNFTKGNYNIVTLAQFEYDDLETKDNSTLYFIKEV